MIKTTTEQFQETSQLAVSNYGTGKGIYYILLSQ